jgi:very-short-patch-repair endonuclease
VLDCATTLPFVQALAVADSALCFGLVIADDLLPAALATYGAGRAARLHVVGHADRRAANAFESALRGVLIDAGLTDFTPQVEIQLPGRRVRVDLADRARKLVIEADSYEYHGTRDGWERDCRRYDDLVAAGWVVLRFTWRQVVDQPAWVAEIVRRTVEQRRSAA